MTLRWHFPQGFHLRERVHADGGGGTPRKISKRHNADLSVSFPANCPKKGKAHHGNGV